MNNIIVRESTHAMADVERMARALASSRLFGVQNPEQAIALCLIAQAEGRHPASAAQDYHIISGRPAKKADAMLRDFLANGGKVEWHALSDDMADATFSHPAGGKVRIAWDKERAKQAQIRNPMWSKYPRQMLRARVVSEGVRTVCPMATSGMYVPEEVQDFDERPAAQGREIEHVAAGDDAVPDGADQQALPAPASKASSRDTYTRLSKANAGLESLAAHGKFWSQRSVVEAFGTLPDDWSKTLAKERDDKRAALEAEADAFGLPSTRTEGAQAADAAPINPDAFLGDLRAEFSSCDSLDALDEAWVLRSPEDALDFPPDVEKAKGLYVEHQRRLGRRV